MSNGDQFLKAFRPSRLALREEEEGQSLDKQANLEKYTLRARAGLPLFDKQPVRRIQDVRKKQ